MSLQARHHVVQQREGQRSGAGRALVTLMTRTGAVFPKRLLCVYVIPCTVSVYVTHNDDRAPPRLPRVEGTDCLRRPITVQGMEPPCTVDLQVMITAATRDVVPAVFPINLCPPHVIPFLGERRREKVVKTNAVLTTGSELLAGPYSNTTSTARH